MRRLAAITAVLSVLSAPPDAFAGDGSAGTLSPFSMGAGGRIMGLGSASAAVRGGSYSLVWNPALLESVDRAEVSLFHTPLIDGDASYYSAVGSYPFLDAGTLSLGLLQFGVSGIEARDEDNLITAADLSSRQSRYLAGYSRRIKDNLTAGLTLKLDRFVEGEYSASGFGADLGFGYMKSFEDGPVEGIALGVILSNLVEPSMKLAEEESGDPRGTRAGVSVWGPLPGDLDDRLLIAFDLADTRLSETAVHAGIEYVVEPYAAIRGGYDDGHLTFGLGFKLSTISLDYAYKTSELESFHLFSLTAGFGATRSQKLKQRRVSREREIQEQIDTGIASYENRFVERSISEAKASMSEGRYEEAAGIFDRVLLMDPGNETAAAGREEARFNSRLIHADSLYERGMYADAILVYRGLADYSGNAEVAARIASCEEMISRAEDRTVQVERIFERGLELYSERRWMEAENTFREVLGLSPGHALAESYLEKSRKRSAEELDRTLARIDEAISAGRYAEATEMIAYGKERYGPRDEFDQRLGRARGMQTDAEKRRKASAAASRAAEAELSTQELERLRPFYEKGAASFREGRFEAAVKAWEPVWMEYPHYENLAEYLIKAYQYWGMELYTRHRYEEALEVWERILRVDGNNEKALRYIRRTREELESLRSLTG
jgi:tetratricopeptide (TPR) repeat protein